MENETSTTLRRISKGIYHGVRNSDGCTFARVLSPRAGGFRKWQVFYLETPTDFSLTPSVCPATRKEVTGELNRIVSICSDYQLGLTDKR